MVEQLKNIFLKIGWKKKISPSKYLKIYSNNNLNCGTDIKMIRINRKTQKLTINSKIT